jgi:hypothetical protein
MNENTDKPFAYVFQYYDSASVYPTLDKAIEDLRKSYLPQDINIQAIYPNGTEQNLDLQYFLLYGFAQENAIDVESINKEVDEKIEKSREAWKKYEGMGITGSAPYHAYPRERLIEQEIENIKFSWK